MEGTFLRALLLFFSFLCLTSWCGYIILTAELGIILPQHVVRESPSAALEIASTTAESAPSSAPGSLEGRIFDLQLDCQARDPGDPDFSSVATRAGGGDVFTEQKQLSRDGGDRQPLLSPYTTNLNALIPHFRRNGLAVTDGVGVCREILDHIQEPDLLCSSPLTDVNRLPDARWSKVTILNRKEGYKVGETIQFRVDLYDKGGKPRRSGGDEIRMWLSSNDSLNAVAVRVIDLHNGTYHGVTELKWPGLTLVKVALTYAREFLRLLVVLRHTLHTMFWVTGVFKNHNTTESTVCLPELPIPGYTTVCNLTTSNGDSPWFCGHPTKPSLECKNWIITGNIDFFAPLPLDSAHAQIVQSIDKPPFVKLIPNDISIFTSDNSLRNTKVLSLPPCWMRPRVQSWTSHTPIGWLEGGTWHANQCRLQDLSKDHVTRCLTDTALLFIGDSNQALFYKVLMGFLPKGDGCPPDTYTQSIHNCRISSSNTSVLYTPHAKPFNVGTKSGARLQTKSLHEAARMLLDQNRTHNVMVVHYFMHNTPYTLHKYRLRVRYTRQTAEEILRLHPNVRIIIRGPHVLYEGRRRHAVLGDNFGPAYRRVWQEEFKDLFDKVWYLDLWDLSVCMVNPTSHPPERIVLQMMKALFGYVCHV